MIRELNDEVLLKMARNRYPITDAGYCIEEALLKAEALIDLLRDAGGGEEFQNTSMNPRMVWVTAWAIKDELDDLRMLLEAAGMIQG